MFAVRLAETELRPLLGNACLWLPSTPGQTVLFQDLMKARSCCKSSSANEILLAVVFVLPMRFILK